MKKQVIITPALLLVDVGDYFRTDDEIYKVINIDYEDELGKGIVLEKFREEELHLLGNIHIKTENEVVRKFTEGYTSKAL